MLAMRLCGNGDRAIPIRPTHLRAFIMWGRVIIGAVVDVLVVVWLATIWLTFVDRERCCQNGNGQFGDCKSVEAFYRSKLRNVGSLAPAISSFAIAPPVIHHQSITCERVGIQTNAHRIMTL